MPTVCKITLDATEYRRELAAVVAASREAARTIGAISSAPTAEAPAAGASAPVEPVKVTVTADTTPAEAEVKKLENKTVTIKATVSADTSAVEQTTKQVEETGEATKKTRGFFTRLIPESLRSKAAQAFGSIRQEMTKTEGGAGKFLEAFKAGGGMIGILIAGVTSLGTIAMSVYNNWINSMKDAADVARRNTESIREVSQANEALRQKTDNYLSKLSDLAALEQLSNAGKAEARMLIDQLTQSYGDLGVTLDATTGKLTGFDAAMAKKLQRDHAQRIRETESELKNLQSDNNAQRDLIDNAGWSGWWLAGIPQLLNRDRNTRIGGEEQAKEAGEKIAENSKRALELRRQLRDLRKNDPVEQFRNAQAAKLADLKESYQQLVASFAQRKIDDSFNSETDPNAKIATRQTLIDNLRQTKIAPLEKQITTVERNLRTATGDDRIETERNLLQLKKQLQTEQEKIYNWNRQIEAILKQQDDAYAHLVNSALDEYEYNQLVLAGEQEQAEALKLKQELQAQNLMLYDREFEEVLALRRALQQQETAQQLADAQSEVTLQRLLTRGSYEAYEAEKLRLEMKRQGKTLTEEETRLLLEQRRALGGQNLKRNLQDQAFELYGQAMSRAGREQEFAQQKALRDAERTKGFGLTEDERELVSQLVSASFSRASARDLQLGDTSIRTNALTARGGFAGGAKLPETDRINREIANTGKLQLEQMRYIASICEKLGAF